MASDSSKFRNLFPILGMALRRPETFLTWVMAIALSMLTASIGDEASLSVGPVAVEAWHWLIVNWRFFTARSAIQTPFLLSKPTLSNASWIPKKSATRYPESNSSKR